MALSRTGNSSLLLLIIPILILFMAGLFIRSINVVKLIIGSESQFFKKQ